MAPSPAAGQGDVGDQQAEQALAFPHGGSGVVPQGWEVFGQGQDAGLLLLIERGVGVAGAGVVIAGLGEFAQPGVPVGFQVAGHQPVGGVDGQVAARCGVGGVLGALHVGGADRVGLAGVGGQFGGDGHGGLQRQRGEGVADQRGDRGVDAGAGDGLAGGRAFWIPARWQW